MERIQNQIFTEALNVESVFSTWGQATVEICHFRQISDRQSHLLGQLVASRPTLAQSSVTAGQIFFCSAYCQHVRQAAVSWVRLRFQEAVSKRYTEISEVSSEQQLGREDFLAFCADPRVIFNSYKIFNKITTVWEIKYYNAIFNHVLRLSLKSNFRWLEHRNISKAHWYE